MMVSFLASEGYRGWVFIPVLGLVNFPLNRHNRQRPGFGTPQKMLGFSRRRLKDWIFAHLIIVKTHRFWRFFFHERSPNSMEWCTYKSGESDTFDLEHSFFRIGWRFGSWESHFGVGWFYDIPSNFATVITLNKLNPRQNVSAKMK